MTEKKVPLYLKEIYGNLYTDPKLFEWLDKQWVQDCLSFGASSSLINAVLKEIEPGNKVLQFGCTFGDQMEQTALKIGKNGTFDVIDISAVQLKRRKNKFLSYFPQIRYFQQNANIAVKHNYDVVVLYMLLHEVPHLQKTKILQAALDSVREGGKVVIIDYHKPKIWHPLRFFVKSFNRLYQPFAEILWDKDIDVFVKDKSKYIWKKTPYFGGMYQKLVIEKKRSDAFAE